MATQKYLDYAGLQLYDTKIKDCITTNRTFYLATVSSNAFSVSIPYITSANDLVEGLAINVIMPAATASGATLNVSGIGAIAIYYRNATAITTHIVAGNNCTFIYRPASGDYPNRWVLQYAYADGNTNTIGYQIRTNSSLWANKTGYAMNRYILLFEVDGGLSGAATTIGTGTSKTTIAFKYIPGGVIKYYSTSGSIANNSNFTATGLWDQYVLDLRYTFNIGSTLVSEKPVYIKMNVNTDGTLTPVYSGSPSHPIVQSLPNTEDGYAYLYLGMAYSTTNIELYNNHPVYCFKNGKLQLLVDSYLPLAGGTLTGVLNSRTIIPTDNNTYDLGDTTYQYANIYGTTLYEDGNSLVNKYAPISISQDNSQNITDTTQLKISGITNNLALHNKSQTDIVEARGNTIAYNQQLKNPDFAENASNWGAYYFGGITSWANGILTLTHTSTGDISQALQKTIPSGHKVLFIARVKTNNNNNIQFGAGNNSSPAIATKTTFDVYTSILTISNNFSRIYLACVGTNIVMNVDYVYMIDLTQAFGSGNEPTSTSDERINWLIKYANEHPEYNAGQLIDSFGKLINTGRNIWDEEWVNGYYYTDTGAFVSNASRVACKNAIRVIPNIEYYLNKYENGFAILQYDSNKQYLGIWGITTLGKFTTDIKCHYIKFCTLSGTYSTYGNTYNNDICINVSDTNFNGTYEPHIKSKQQLSELRSAGSVYDSQVGNKITRRVGSVDLGTLTWVKDSTFKRFYTTGLSLLIKKPTSDTLKGNLICSLYPTESVNDILVLFVKAIGVSSAGNISINETGYEAATANEFKTAMSGVYLEYELATPTTEDALPISPMATYYSGYEMQDSPVPYTLVRQYNLSIFDNTESFVDNDRITLDNLNYIKNNYLQKSETATDSNKLGGQLPSYYTDTANIGDDNFGDTLDNILQIFDTAIGNKLDKSGGTMTGTITSRDIIPDTKGSRKLGDTNKQYQTIYGYRIGLGDSAAEDGEAYFYNESHNYTATLKSNPSQSANVVATLPKTSGTLLTSTQIGEITIDDDASQPVIVSFNTAPTAGEYMFVPDDNYANYWQGGIAHLSSNKGSFRMAKSVGNDAAYVQFTYSGTTVTNTSADSAADYGHFYIYKIR